MVRRNETDLNPLTTSIYTTIIITTNIATIITTSTSHIKTRLNIVKHHSGIKCGNDKWGLWIM